MLILLGKLAREQQARLTGTWKNIVRLVVQQFGGSANLQDIYEAVAKNAPDKIAGNPSWREKIRQTLNSNESMFSSVDRGTWKLA